MKTLKGGPLAGHKVPAQREDDSWFTAYTLNGKLYTPTPGTFYMNFPDGVIRHGYRKQKDGQFSHIWSRPNKEV